MHQVSRLVHVGNGRQLGPSQPGGLQPLACLFDGIAWSTSAVMAQTRDRLQAAGLRWAELPAVADVDEPADLVHVPAGWLP